MQDLPFQKKKKRAVRLRFLLWPGVGLLLGTALIGFAYFVLYADFLKVESFEVNGSRLVSDDVLFASLNTEMIGDSRLRSLLGSDNILFWEFGKKPEFLSSLPALREISVETNLGERKVIIDVHERELFGIWCVLEDDCYGFDQQGIIFARVPEVQGVLILKIKDINDHPVILGNPIFSDPVRIESIFQTLRTLDNYDFIVSSVEIRDLALEEWHAEVVSGPVFFFSLNFVPDNLEGIIKNLDKRFEFSKVTYFDFRVPNRIYYQ